MAQGGCGCLLLTLGATVVGFWAGCQGLFTAGTNLSPTEMTCAEFEADQQNATWVKLTECEADYIDTIVEETSTGRIEKMYFPVVAAGADFEEQALIVLETEEDERIEFVEGVFGKLEMAGDDMAMLQALMVFQEQRAITVEGMVEFGWELDDDTRREVGGLAENVRPDFIMIREGAKPSFIGSFAWLGLGFLGLFGFFVMLSGFAADDE